MVVKVTIKNQELIDKHVKLIASLVRNWKPALNQVKEFVWQEEQKIFKSEGAYDGRPKWKELSDKYKKWKDKKYAGKSILRRTDALYNQATSNAGINEVSDFKLEVGTDILYGFYHQQGTKKMKARPYMTVTENEIKKINTIINDYVLEFMKAEGLSIVRITK